MSQADGRESNKRGAVLTTKEVEALRAGHKKADGYVRGRGGRLIVRARPGVARVTREFIFRWRDDKGADRTVLISAFDPKVAEKSLAHARSEALKLQQIVRGGGDPAVSRLEEIERKRSADDEFRRQGTFGALLNGYVAYLYAQKKTSAKEVEDLFKHYIAEPFPALLQRKAKDVAPADITAVIARLIKKGITRRSNMALGYITAAFNWAVKSEHDPAQQNEDRPSFGLGERGNPAAMVKRQKEYDRARDRVVSDQELRALWLRLCEYEGTGIEVALTIRIRILLGAPRATQLLRCTWDDYDEKARVIRIRDSKGRGPVRDVLLPVSERVAAMLATLHWINGKGEYIFSSTEGAAPIHLNTVTTLVSDLAREICKEQGEAEYFTAGDLRRTAETKLAALGVSREIRSEILSHGRVMDVVARHYDRHDYLPEKSAALAKWEGYLFDVFEQRKRGEAVVVRPRFGHRAAV